MSLGVGYFGLQFSLGFPMTVLLAHAAFGAVLGRLAPVFRRAQPSLAVASLRSILSASPYAERGEVPSGV